MDFSKLSDRVFAAYCEERYADLLALVEENEDLVPERAPTVRFWKACALTRLGRHGEAVDALEEGLADGMWWSRDMLLEDEDLQLLADRRDFQEFVELSAAIAEGAPLDLTPPLVRGEAERGSLAALHGSGDNPNDTFSVWGAAAEHGMQLIVARSAKRFAPDVVSWDKRSFAKDLRLILEATNAFSPIVLGGFSQGASLPLWNALVGELDVTGVIAVCPTIRPESNRTPTPDQIAAAVVRGDRRLRLFCVIGGQDPLGPAGLEAVEAMRAASYPVHIEYRKKLGHAFPEDFDELLPQALDFVLGPSTTTSSSAPGSLGITSISPARTNTP